MNIFDLYQQHFGSSGEISNNDFSLIEYDSNIMIGVDSATNLCVVLKSSTPNRFPLKLKTANMNIECNVKVRYNLRGEANDDTVHILRCFSQSSNEKKIFLELATVLIQEGTGTEESIIETFNTLRSFFKDKQELSDNELIGLYAELYTIHRFHDSLEIEKFWQSRDRMKFDFSFTEKTKLEVKATVKNTRTHHFLHEQLMTGVYNIYVLSYLLRYDDEGLSLYDLLKICRELVSTDSRKLLRLSQVLKNTSEERLKSIRFNCDYTEANRHIYRASDIPRFNQVTPRGVANAEYDCVLDNVSFIDDDVFLDDVKVSLQEERHV